MMKRPTPEYTGHRYGVTKTKAEPGFPMTNLQDKMMAVPLGATPTERAIRAHEVAHALYTPMVDTKARRVRAQSFLAAEEARVNSLCVRAGIPMDTMTFEEDRISAEQSLQSDDLRDVARTYCVLTGGRRATWDAVFAEQREYLADDWLAEVQDVLDTIDRRIDTMDPSDVDWSVKLGRWMDGLANPNKPKQQKPKQQKQQGKSDPDQQRSAPPNDDDEDWGDEPEASDDDDADDADDETDAEDWGDDGDDDADESESDGDGEEDDDESDEVSGTNDDESEAEDDSEADSNDDGDSDDDADDGDWADGDDDDADDYEAGGEPHCALDEKDWSELNESNIQRAVVENADPQRGIEAWEREPAHSMPNPLGPGAWDETIFDGYADEPERTEQTDNGEYARKRRLARAGFVRRADQLFVKDGSPYSRKRKAPGGTVLVDMSGSMGLSREDVETILKAAPGCTIAGYNTVMGLRILVKDGMMVPWHEVQPGGGNGIDGPALRWLADQEGPRAWVSDNYVNGAGAVTAEALYRECAEICLAGRILRVDPDPPDSFYLRTDEQKRHRIDAYYAEGVGKWMVPTTFQGYQALADALTDYWKAH